MTIAQAVQTGIDQFTSGRMPEAEATFRGILGQDPHCAEALHMLGMIAGRFKHFDDAEKLMRRAVQLRPDNAEYHGNLGIILSAQGRLEEGVAEYEKALKLRPIYPVVFNNYGAVLKSLGRLQESRDLCRKACELIPEFAEAHYNLANAYVDLGELESAIDSFHRALKIQPGYAQCWNNLSNVLKSIGRIDEGIDAGRRAIQADPTHSGAHSNLIFALYFHPDVSAAQILQEQERFDRQHCIAVAGGLPPADPINATGRKLRIGYVSCDFREHVVGWNMLPILENHDHQQFQIVCYSSQSATDANTAKLRALSEEWRDVGKMDDAALAKMIRQDHIDILVDLSLHTSGNRLLAFARKPAPVQLSYLGYCGGAGISAIQYRLSDPHLDNAHTESDYRERTIYLPQSYWCYRPGADVDEPADAPVLRNRFITFGCLSNFTKVSAPARTLFARILRRNEKSRFILHAPAGQPRQMIADEFENAGIDRNRVEFIGKLPPREYLKAYDRIDVVLDTFPYNGAITSCDALWMGVPVVTLVGTTSVGRAGKSILTNVGLTELIAQNTTEYAEIATKLAGDIERLIMLRKNLRHMMQNSPLMNGRHFTHDLEAIYRRLAEEKNI